jgi:hypothetical protein
VPTQAFLIIGSIVNYAGAIYFFRKWLAVKQRGKLAEGRIVDLISGDNGFFPVVEFILDNGKRFKFTNKVATTWYRKGKKVRVIYDPADPEQAIVNDFASTLGMTLVGLVVGTIFLIWGIATIVAGSN